MTDRITLLGLRGFGRHGVYESERTVGQPFVADVVLNVDTTVAARSDDLADTVSYADVAALVVAVIEGEPVNLLETLAARIAEACLSDVRVESVEVTVHKPEAPVGVTFTDVSVSIQRARS